VKFTSKNNGTIIWIRVASIDSIGQMVDGQSGSEVIQSGYAGHFLPVFESVGESLRMIQEAEAEQRDMWVGMHERVIFCDGKESSP